MVGVGMEVGIATFLVAVGVGVARLARLRRSRELLEKKRIAPMRVIRTRTIGRAAKRVSLPVSEERINITMANGNGNVKREGFGVYED
jgi:hypothetical protein